MEVDHNGMGEGRDWIGDEAEDRGVPETYSPPHGVAAAIKWVACRTSASTPHCLPCSCYVA